MIQVTGIFICLYLFECLFPLGDLGDIGKISADLILIKTVTCEPLVIDLKSVILNRDRHEYSVRIKEHGTESDICGLLHLKILDDVCGCKTGSDYIFDNENMFARDIYVYILADPDDAGFGSGIGDVGKTDHIDLYRKIDRSGEVRQKIK